jgi:predicted TIM-barrel enzyme
MRIPREECLRRLRKTLSDGKIILGVGGGIGLSAKCAELGGADLIIVYNSGRFRMAGRSSACGILPLGDANTILMDMAREVLPVVKNTPVLAGVNGVDPFIQMDIFLKQVADIGFSGVQNYPTVAGKEGYEKQMFEETGLGFGLEVDLIAKAHDMDLLTTPYAFDEEQAKDMTKAGADVIVAHMLMTTGGLTGIRTAKTLDESAALVQKIHDAAKSVRSDVLVICHGGPVAEPKDLDYIMKNTEGIVGYYGASSIERLATERAITQLTKEFKTISIR